MAITVSQQPQKWTPGYNDQWITALSTQIAQPNFKYQVDVSITYDLNGTPTTNTFTYLLVPRPDGYLVYNAKPIVIDFIQHFIKPNDFSIVEAVNEVVSVSIDVSETWTGQTATATETIPYNAWNACLTEKDFYNYSEGDYISQSVYVRVHSIATLGLLSYPFEKQTLKADVYLHFVKPSTLDSINYKLIDTNGVDILNDIDLTGTMTNDKIYQINISPQLAEDTWGGVTEGMYIQVDFYTAGLSVLYTYTYKIYDLCTKHEVNRIYYLNRRGGVSSFPFEMLSTKTIDAKTNEVRKNRNKLVSGEFTYLPYQHESNIVSTKEITLSTLQTNWLTAQQSIWLEELYSSPKKWIVNEENDYGDAYNYIPVTMISKPYLVNKHENEKLFNYAIEVQYSTQETRQRAI